MVTVAMRNDSEIQLGEVDSAGPDIAPEYLGVVAGVEQDPLPAILDVGGKPPVELHFRTLAEGVVKDGDLGLSLFGLGARWAV